MPIEYAPDQQWPPAACSADNLALSEYGIWYRSEMSDLAAWYESRPDGTYPAVRPSQYRGGIVGWMARRFWGRPPSQAQPARLHIPAAPDISALSSDLLLSEAPAFRVEADKDGARERETERWIQDALEREAGYAAFGEAGEYASAYGSVFLRAVLDTEVADRPFVNVVNASAAVPEWRSGRLAAVTFWRCLTDGSSTVWRHLERHEKGANFHALYRGSPEKLGERTSLGAHPETAWLLERGVGEDGRVDTGIDMLDVAHWPNLKPNRRNECSEYGRSDYDAAMIEQFEALDELWTLLMEDFRLARARLIVPEGYLRGLGPGKGASFDVDQRIFVALKISDPDKPLQIQQAQFDVRVEQHLSGIGAKWRDIVKHAGLSADAFGEESSSVAATATEIGQRGARTVATRKRKTDYATQPLAHIGLVLIKLGIAAKMATPGVKPIMPRIVWPDGVTPDGEKQARIVQLLDAATAASTVVKVSMAHPEWDQEQIDAEVALIEGDKAAEREAIAASMPDPNAAPPTPADPNAPPTDGAQTVTVDQPAA